MVRGQKPHGVLLLVLALILIVCAGCRSAYYAAWEQFGKHKRDLLRESVVDARDDQEAASEQFKDALTRLRELYGVKDGGDLEKIYDRLKVDYDRSVNRADAVHKRIKDVEQVADDLFEEWDGELRSISNDRLKQDSAQKLRATRQKYDSLHAAMKRAEKSMDPVLRQFNDQVLYLKHNLNAQAISSLRGETMDIEKEIAKLIEDMNASIAEANSFIRALPK
jgi:hypothetical protein